MAFHLAHLRRNPVFLTFGDLVTCCFDLLIIGATQVAVAFALPAAWLVLGLIHFGAVAGRPSALVLAPYPAGLLCRLIPFLRYGLLLCREPARRDGLLGGNRHAQVVVGLLPVARLGFGAAGPGGPAAGGTLVVPAV